MIDEDLRTMERNLSWDNWEGIVRYRQACIRAGRPELAGFWPGDVVLNRCSMPSLAPWHEARLKISPYDYELVTLPNPRHIALSCSHRSAWTLIAPAACYAY